MPVFPKIQSICPLKAAQFASAMDGDICRACDTKVHDLNAMTDEERIAFIKSRTGPVCVSYNPHVRAAVTAAAIAAAAALPLAAAAQVVPAPAPEVAAPVAGQVVAPPSPAAAPASDPAPTGLGGGANPAGYGMQSINLRNMGSGRTLLVLNGRRLADDPVITPADPSAVPMAVLNQVEILKDGGGAQFGADAVVGAIKDFDNVEFITSVEDLATPEIPIVYEDGPAPAQKTSAAPSPSDAS